MKALAAERAEVEQEGCKPEFRIAQRQIKMIMQRNAEEKHGHCRSGVLERDHDGAEPEDNMRKGGERR